MSRTDADDEAIMAEASRLSPLRVGPLHLKVRHIGVNRIYEDRHRSVVVRVHHDDVARSEIDATLDRVRRLRRSGVPVITPLADRCVELPDSSCWATYWPRHEDNADFQAKTFGRFVARWHMMALSSDIASELPTFMGQALARVRAYCDQALSDGVPADITEALLTTIDRAVVNGADADPQIVLHGDMHKRNVVTKEGQILSIDPDSMCVGRSEHDLAPMAMAILRYHTSGWDLRSLLKGYRSHDAPFNMDALLQAVKVREVLTSLHGLTLWDDPTGRAELLRRVGTMNAPPSSDVRWQPFVRVTSL